MTLSPPPYILGWAAGTPPCILGKPAWASSCGPAEGYGSHTFSVGVFEWVERSTRFGVKRGLIKVRVEGLSSQSEAVYAKAAEVVNQLDAGTYTGPKRIRVKS
jgi:hypothetical protein